MISKRERGNRTGERGNVLFLILIAVALFAALSYAVTQSSRSGGGDASRETSRIGSAQITQYPAGVRTTLIRMIVAGADPTMVEFNRPTEFGNCTGDSAGTYDLCVFHPQGGGATYVQAPGEVMAAGGNGTWLFSGDNEILNIGTNSGAANSSAATADPIAFLPGVSNAICAQINDELGIGASNAETGILFLASVNQMVSTDDTNPDPANEVQTAFNGDGGVIGDVAGSVSLAGQPFGCFTQGGQNIYYHVLIER